MRIVVIHGPNLNLLGRREPEIYGRTTLTEIDERLRSRAVELKVELATFQSNHEGALIDRVQSMVLASPGDDGLIVNPGGYTHTSVALRDAIAAVARPAWEVHLSDPGTREAFRHVSLVRDVCTGYVQGRGADGYVIALEALVAHLRADEEG